MVTDKNKILEVHLDIKVVSVVDTVDNQVVMMVDIKNIIHKSMLFQLANILK